MLQVLRAELRYGMWGLSMVLLVPLVYAFELQDGESTEFLILIFALLTVNLLFAMRSREHRCTMLALLPVPRWQLGLSRLLLVIVPAAVILLSYAALHLIQPPADGFDPGFLIAGSGLVLTSYSLIFFAKDLFAEFLGRYGRIVRGGAVVLLALFTALGVILLLKTKSTGGGGNLRSIFDTVQAYNPFSGELGPLKFLALSIVLAGLTVVSYRRRRSFVAGSACR